MDILDATSVLRYLREELGHKSDLQYQGPFGGGYPPATAFRGDWMSVRWNRSVTSPPGLSAALAADPDLRVFHACGYFDLLGRALCQRLRCAACRACTRAAHHVARVRRRPRDLRRRWASSSAAGGCGDVHSGWRPQVMFASRLLAIAAVVALSSAAGPRSRARRSRSRRSRQRATASASTDRR